MTSKRKKVWFEPVPGLGLKAVDLRQSILFGDMRRILIRDLDGHCLYDTVVPQTLSPRD